MKITHSVFDVQDYRKFINAEFDSPRFGRGSRSRLAKHLGVQISFISLVLSGRQSFSADHGMRIAQFLGLDSVETEYFVFLIELDRAGSESLKRHYQSLLNRILDSRKQVKSRLKTDAAALDETELSEYYSCWFHIAVHMSIRNLEHQSPESIATALGITAASVRKSIKVLERLRLIKKEKGRWFPTQQRLHVEKGSTALRAHHTNWRNLAIRSLDEGSRDDLHYSLVMSVDEEAVEKIRTILLKSIGEADLHVRAAKDKRVYALNIDLFSVLGLNPKHSSR